jgi:SAM-dependent methyltransferase
MVAIVDVVEDLTNPDPTYTELYKRFGKLNSSWPWLSQLTQPTNKRKIEILDLGCGMGRVASPLINDGYQVTGVDANPHMLQGAKETVPLMNLIQERIERLKLFKKFDIVILASLILSNCDEEQRLPILNSVVAHLSQKGYFAFQTYNPEWLRQSCGKVFPLQELVFEHFDADKEEWHGYIVYFFPDLHYRQKFRTKVLDRERLDELLEKVGLKLFHSVNDSPISCVHFARHI